MFNVIRLRLLAWNFVVFFALLVGLGTGIFYMTARTLNGEVNAILREGAAHALRDFSATPGFPMTLPQHGYPSDVFYLSVDTSGELAQNPQRLAVDASPDPEGVLRALEGEEYYSNVEINDQTVRLLSVAVLTPSGAPLGVLQVGQSIESQQRALAELAWILAGSEFGALALALVGGWFLANRALVPTRRAFERQRRFVADASHELRTPLTLIRGNAELIRRHRGQTIEENAHLVEGIIDEAGYLSDMVTSLLTLEQSDGGRLALREEAVDLCDLVRQVCNDTQPLAVMRELTLECAEPPFGVTAQGDRERLRQVLLALMDNALKYTPPGGRIDLRLEFEDNTATIAVSDTGLGIQAEHLPHVFDRFYRVDAARREPGGSGLGLSIAKALVEAHRGSISLESPDGSGVTATIRLTAERGESEPTPSDGAVHEHLASEKAPLDVPY